MKQLSMILFSLFSFTLLQAQKTPSAELYGFGQWDSDSLGNHRIVLAVDEPADAVLATMDWRRKDRDPAAKDLVVVDAVTGQRITNVTRFNVDRERGEIVFQPQTVPGEYYVYYLKSSKSGSHYYPVVHYPPFEETASPEWLKKNRLTGSRPPALPVAKVVQYQAIRDLHSFYPMEIIATESEKKALLKKYSFGTFILFTEDRRYPIRMTSDIPYKWIEEDRHDYFTGDADQGEYYVFQLGLWAARGRVDNVKLDYSDLVNPVTGERIPSSVFTCFNTGGTDVTGTEFEKECSVERGKIQALWIGLQIPEQITAGKYAGIVTVSTANGERKEVEVSLNVSDRRIANHGDDEPWRHSRLRWLNSQIGMDDEVISPYTPLLLKEGVIDCLGRKVELSSLGLPEQITSYFKETMTGIGGKGRPVLASPIELVAEGGAWENLNFEITSHKKARITWKALNQNSCFLMELDGEMESDGNLSYKITLIARTDGDVNDISLHTLLSRGVAKYMMGLGEKGGYCPKDFQWKWGIEKNQEGAWIGDVNAGLQWRFYDDQYDRPLNTNFYQQKPLIMPASWCNDGKGGIAIRTENNGTLFSAYSGKREVKKGDRLYYHFNLAITPFRPIDTDKQWRERYYHNYKFIDEVEKYGANVINIHHANAINPFINYPFLRTKEMKAYIDGAHARDMKVKIYNTVRELSNSCVEIYALRSLGNEIFSEGTGGGFSWLQEHLDQNYIAAWFAPNVEDASIINSGVSRWHNYYVEGVNWLAREVGIDGLYIDDLAFDRMTMKRVRKMLDRANADARIDLHSANQYNQRDGFTNSANLYLEHFPYIDRLWYGEYFDHDFPPEFWMVELAGIPYGVMGEMLWEGGNRWRGMLYGMTGRATAVDNRPLWKLWDHFGIRDSEMIGYWVSHNPVKTNSEKTLATIYRHKGKKTLISLATWEDKDALVHLTIDWKELGLDGSKARLYAPEIEEFQSESTWEPGEMIVVPQGKGLLIVVE